MGQKVNPKVIRLNTTFPWQSRWLARKKEFARALQEDTRIREFVWKRYPQAGVDKVEIERYNDAITLIIRTTRPGMIIGRAGGGVEDMKKQLKQQLKLTKDLKVNIEEVKQANLSAQVWASTIAEQILKRISHRRAMKQAVDTIMESGAKGVRVAVKGRLGGAEIARVERLYKGALPLHTLRNNIDYGSATAMTTYGTIGIKVWINLGEQAESKTSPESVADKK